MGDEPTFAEFVAVAGAEIIRQGIAANDSGPSITDGLFPQALRRGKEGTQHTPDGLEQQRRVVLETLCEVFEGVESIEPEPPKWEYRVTTVQDKGGAHASLDAMGEQGWELVSVRDQSKHALNTLGPIYRCFWKRPAQKSTRRV